MHKTSQVILPWKFWRNGAGAARDITKFYTCLTHQRGDQFPRDTTRYQYDFLAGY